MNYKVKLTEDQHQEIMDHLYPGDGLEAVSVALCGRLTREEEIIYLVHKIVHIPYDKCEIREPDYLKWSTDLLFPMLKEAERMNLSVLKIHSHPGGYAKFSETDNQSDLALFSSVLGWTQEVDQHLSCIMLPDGTVFGRIIDDKLSFSTIQSFTLVGDNITRSYGSKDEDSLINTEANKRNLQTFGSATTNILSKMSVGVVGCSGTGSIVIEQLARLGVGKLVIIDPDRVEKLNLNRILNTKVEDADNKRYKVEVIKEAVESFGFNTQVKAYTDNIFNNPEALKEIAASDAIFGCVDTVDARHLMNLISSYYIVPLFDIGVRLDAYGKGGIEAINGSIHYIKPGGSSLISRRVYTSEDIMSAGNLRKNPEHYKSLLQEKYIKGVQVDSPAVISINMFYASMAVNEFLARIHPFRVMKNGHYSIQRFTLSDPLYYHEEDGEPDSFFLKTVGRGDLNPLLGLPELS